jgi:hypothetical protein
LSDERKTGESNMTVHPINKDLKNVIEATQQEVRNGRPYVNAFADGGYTVVSQRIEAWNSRKPRFLTQVWLNGKLLKKAAWLKTAT